MADKKISELPLLNSVSGSSIIIPIVHDGTTVKLNLSQLGHYSSQWSAKTGSANTFTGNQSVIGNVNISGKLTVNSIEAVYETSSILYTSGSSQFGDQISDVHTMVGTFNLNGLAIGTSELMAQTASQAAVNLRISSTTGSINTTTSSFNTIFSQIGLQTGSQNLINIGISSVTGSINIQSSSQDLVNRGISSVTGAMNTTTSSFNSEFVKIGSTTSSLHFTTGALNAFTGSIIGQVSTIGTFTSSVNFATQSLNTQTGSQDSVNIGISSTTGSINTTTSSFNSVFSLIGQQTASQDLVNRQVSLVTGSVHFVTGAFNAFTGSVVGQTNTIATFTSSVNFATQSLNTQTGSQELINNRIASTTGSINTTTSSFNSVFSQIGSTTSSLIGITNGLMAFTASLDNTYATDAQLYQLYQATASIHSTSASLNTQTGSQQNLNAQIGIATSSLNTFSGSVRSEINLLESYTASLKAAAIVSSSTQIQNYFTFAQTASANTFYGTQTLTGSFKLNDVSSNFSIVGNGFGQTYLNSLNGALVLNPDYGGVQLVGSYPDLQTNGTITATTFGGAINATNNVVSSSTQIQNYNVFALNSNLYNSTGSLQSQLNGIMAVTASMKAAAIVSSSQQIKNYYTFAQTASANIFYGNQTFDTNTLFIDSANHRVGIKTITPGRDVEINGDTTILGNNYIATNKFFQFEGGAYFTLRTVNSGNTLQFYRGDDTSVPMAININNGVNFDGAVTASKFKVASGGGLDFSANTGGAGKSSQLLNDYEEGIHAVTITPSTSGTVTLNSGYDSLSYVKIGSIVHVSGLLSVTSVSSPLGSFRISLPFQCANLADSAGTATANIVVNGTVATNVADFVGWADELTSYIAVYRADGTSVAATSAAQLQTNSDIYVQLTYRTS